MIRAESEDGPTLATRAARVQAHDGAPGEVNGGQLLAIVQRIERLESEIAALNDDKKEVYAEGKSNGYDPKIIKKIVAIRRADPEKRSEEEILTDIYLNAVTEAEARG